ncbi:MULTISPECIES: GSCFA domain-containing protein [unclassified Sphingobium]|uniref:GSCFA domain-containing protein n=1 Tax=unclassified Sphingobium TaxID=2611147 RepID=UPI000D15BF8C|nr:MULTISPECIES: GSCFA domain-containing protein [unclassified Sphingobium]PSO09694.1 GSCFA family protein [Sphingobium sp. AEW4]TWD19015.1 GSCFA family protein [Sphingobium sp. AEW013]
MANPYRQKPATSFWKKSVAIPAAIDVDPVISSSIVIGPESQIATAGSCFAQHIARTLAREGFHYLVEENEPAFSFSQNENYGTFSARYGNIYTVRQLLQLFDRAHAIFEPQETAWRRSDGRFIDPFRPQIQSDGFETVEQLCADRASHLVKVRSLFEKCDVFIFTLGLTEAWLSTRDGSVFPLAPGVVSPDVDPDGYRFHNFTVQEIEHDLLLFLERLGQVNPKVRVILTVSPVPLIATYEPKHVLCATTYSKAVLRVVAEQIAQKVDWVEYFPSYEMITGPHTRGAFYEEDLREVRPEGVAYVMSVFSRHYLSNGAQPAEQAREQAVSEEEMSRQKAIMDQLSSVICDETAIEENL